MAGDARGRRSRGRWFPGTGTRPRLCSRFPAALRRSVCEGGGSHKGGRWRGAGPGRTGPGRAPPPARRHGAAEPRARRAPATHQPRGSASPLPPPRARPETAAHVSGCDQRAPQTLTRSERERAPLPSRSAGALAPPAAAAGSAARPGGRGPRCEP